jgi:hypothetical protein
MNSNEIYKFMSNDNVIMNVALLAGFIQALMCGNFLESPLSSVCWAIIFALIYSCLACVVVSISPNILKPAILLILIFSVIYYILFKKTCMPKSIIEIQVVEDEENKKSY